MNSSAPTATGTSNVVYTFELLSNYFENSLNEAAELLSISTTRLKSICRSLNIKRWPYRRIVSLKQRQNQLEMQLEQMKRNSVQAPQNLNMVRLDIEQVKRDILDVKTNPKNSFIVGTSKQTKGRRKKEEDEEDENEEEVVATIEDRTQNTLDLKKSFYKLDQQMKRNLNQGQTPPQQYQQIPPSFGRTINEEAPSSNVPQNRNSLLRTQSMKPTLDSSSATPSHTLFTHTVENRLQSNHTLLRQRQIPTLQIFEQPLPSINELFSSSSSQQENTLWRQNSFIPFHISPTHSPRKVEDDYEDEEEQVVPYQNQLLPMQQQPSSANLRRSPTSVRRTRSLSPSRRNVTKTEVVHFSPYVSPRSNSASPRTENKNNVPSTLPSVYSVTHNNQYPPVGSGVSSNVYQQQQQQQHNHDLSPTIHQGMNFMTIEQQEQLLQQQQQQQQQQLSRSSGGTNMHKLDINFILNK